MKQSITTPEQFAQHWNLSISTVNEFMGKAETGATDDELISFVMQRVHNKHIAWAFVDFLNDTALETHYETNIKTVPL